MTAPWLTTEAGLVYVYPHLLCLEHQSTRCHSSHNKRPDSRCSTYATAVLARAKKVLGNDSVELLGPSTILLKNNFTLQLPIVVRATNETGKLGDAKAAVSYSAATVML